MQLITIVKDLHSKYDLLKINNKETVQSNDKLTNEINKIENEIKTIREEIKKLKKSKN